MSCLITSLTFIFLLTTIGAQTISFLTSYMVVNRYSPGLHDGIFQRCGALGFFQTMLNSFGSYITKTLDGTVETFSSCYWWNSSIFCRDRESLQAVIVLSFISVGTLMLTFILFLLSLVRVFKNRPLNVFLGLLMMFNCLLLISIILIYSFLYAHEARITPDISSPEALMEPTMEAVMNAISSRTFTALGLAASLFVLAACDDAPNVQAEKDAAAARSAASAAADSAKTAVEQAGQAVSHGAAAATENARQAGAAAAEATRETAEQATEATRQAAQQAGEAIRSGYDAAKQAVTESTDKNKAATTN